MEFRAIYEAYRYPETKPYIIVDTWGPYKSIFLRDNYFQLLLKNKLIEKNPNTLHSWDLFPGETRDVKYESGHIVPNKIFVDYNASIKHSAHYKKLYGTEYKYRISTLTRTDKRDSFVSNIADQIASYVQEKLNELKAFQNSLKNKHTLDLDI